MTHSRSYRSAVVLTIIILLQFFSFYVWSTVVDIKTSVTYLSLSLLVLSLTISFYGEKEYSLFSPLSTWAFIYGLFYAAAGVVAVNSTLNSPTYIRLVSLAYNHLPDALLLTQVCLVFLYFGYSYGHLKSINRSVYKFATSGWGSATFVWTVLFVMGVLGFAVSIAFGQYSQANQEDNISPVARSASGLLQSGLFLALPLSFSFYFIKRTKLWLSKALVTLLFFLIIAVPSGSKTLLILPVVLISISYNYSVRKLTRSSAFLFAIVGLSGLIALMPFNAIYRAQIKTLNQSDIGFKGNASSLTAAYDTLLAYPTDELIELTVNYSAQRSSTISIVALCLKATQEGFPLQYGETYVRSLYAFIPRPIWPNKPLVSISPLVPVWLGLSPPNQYIGKEGISDTAVGITSVGEAVINFSFVGAPLMFYIIGAILKSIHSGLFCHKYSPQPFAIALWAWFWYAVLFYLIEGSFSSIFTGAIKFIILLMLIKKMSRLTNRRSL